MLFGHTEGGKGASISIYGKNIQKSPSHTTHLKDHSGLLQQVGPHVGSNDVVPLVEAYLNILSKAAAVVIASGFGISDGLFTTNKRCTKPGGLSQFQDCMFMAASPSLPLPSLWSLSAFGVTMGQAKTKQKFILLPPLLLRMADDNDESIDGLYKRLTSWKVYSIVLPLFLSPLPGMCT